MADTPEIQDLNVLSQYRKNDIGTHLIQACERHATKKASTLGIAVGLSPAYNSAQKLYSSLGYKLDGKGVYADAEPIKEGKAYAFDDGLVLYFTKSLNPEVT